MKKKYLFLTLALAWLGGSNQSLQAKVTNTVEGGTTAVTTIDALFQNSETEAIVLIKANKSGGFMHETSATNKAVSCANLPSDKKDQVAYVWKISKTGTSYTFQNYTSSCYIQKGNRNSGSNPYPYLSTVSNLTEADQVVFVSKGEGKWDVKSADMNTPNYYWHVSRNKLHTWSSGPNYGFSFYPCTVTTKNLVIVTYQYKTVDGTLFHQEVISSVYGENYAAPTAPALDFYTFTQPTGNVGGGNVETEAETKVIVCSQTIPIPFTTTTVKGDVFAPVTKWYYMKLDNHYCAYDATTTETTTPETPTTGDDNDLFAFEGNLTDGFTIYNKALPSYKLWELSGKHPTMVANSACTGTNQTWFLSRNEKGTTKGYSFANSGNKTNLLNRKNSGTEENKYLQYWNVLNDNGSRMAFEINTYDITINATGYATFSADVATTIPTGVTAYIAKKTAGASTLTLTALPASSILPANTGVILKGTANTTYSFVKSTDTPATIGTNELKATSETPVQADAKKSYYVLNDGGGSVNQIGFYKATSASVIPANKAYYIGTGAKSLLFEGDDLTGIDGVIGKEATEITGKYYQLNGIEEKNPVKGGIYLHNGKKILK